MTIRQALESIYTSECPRSVLELLKDLIEAMDGYQTPPYVEDVTITRVS